MSNKSHKTNQSGFTLVEIAIAVAILGLAFTTLVGLHTKMLNNYGIERNRNMAAMIGQYMLAMIEVSPTPPEVGGDSGDLKSKLQDFGFFDTDDNKTNFDEEIKGWEFNTTVTSGDLEELKDVYRRIELKLNWGDGPEDSFDFVYFVFTKSYRSSGASAGGGANPLNNNDPNNPYYNNPNASQTLSGNPNNTNNSNPAQQNPFGGATTTNPSQSNSSPNNPYQDLLNAN